MAQLIDVTTFQEQRGSLSVLEFEELPFRPKRIYYIYNVDDSVRAKHRHKETRQILICLNGSCEVYINNGTEEWEFSLNKPEEGLLVEPEDWHSVKNFSENSILLVLASEPFDTRDYIHSPY